MALSEEPGKVFASEPTRREWLRQPVDLIVQLVAGDEFGIEHPDILIALLDVQIRSTNRRDAARFPSSSVSSLERH